MRIIALLAIFCAAIGSASGQSARQSVAPARPAAAVGIDGASGSRLPLLARDDMQGERALQIYDALAGADSAPPPGTIAIALYSPETAAALARMHGYLTTESALGPGLSALLGLITAREMSLAYEWSVRVRAASDAGLDARLVDIIRRNAPATGLAGDDALVVDFARQLYRTRHVDAESFAAMVQRFGRQGTFDAIMLLTYYSMAGLMQRAVDQQPPADWDPRDLPDITGVGTPPGRIGVFVELGPRPPLAPDVDEASYYRFPLLERTALDVRGREVFDALVGADNLTAPRGPVGMTLNSPELAEPIQQINTALRINGAIGQRLSEIVVAATGREMNSQYQWIVHGAAAERAGASRQVLDAIRDDADLSGLDEPDAVAIAFTRQLFREPAVLPETFAAAMRLFGARGTVEIAALAGDYLMVTTMYNALGMRLRPDQEPTLPHRADAPVGAEWR
jgi:4-carboxymuconolactone decarboxylase